MSSTRTSRGRSVALARAPLLGLVCANVCYRAALAIFAGPYWLILKEMRECSKQEVEVKNPDVRGGALFRYNHTIKKSVLDGNVTLSNRVFTRGETKMTLDIARWDTVSGWREHFLMMPLGELCFVYEEVAVDIVKYLTMAVPGVSAKCPVADGSYAGENAVAQLAPLRHFPSLPYGRYKVILTLNYIKPSKPKEPRACFKAVADVVPKN